MKVVCHDRTAALRAFAKATDPLGDPFEKPYLLTFEEFKPPRGLNQNAKLHVMLRELANHIGYSEGELKDYFKQEYGRKKAVNIGGREKLIPVSTVDYTREEMALMLNHVDRLSAESGVYVEGE